jgi:hypothetical protein
MKPTGIVRVGWWCDRYGKNFDYTVAVTVDWFDGVRWLLGIRPVPITIKAMVASKVRPLSYRHSVTILRLLRDRGFSPEWDNLRRKKMEKEPLHHVDEAKKDDGSFDHDLLAEHAGHAMEQIMNGHYRIIEASQEDLGDGKTRITFVRQEV